MQEHGIPNRLKLARVERNLTQAELAELVGVTRQTIGLIEGGGHNPALQLCSRVLCERLSRGRFKPSQDLVNLRAHDALVS